MAKFQANEQQLEFIRENIGKKQLTRISIELGCTVSILERICRNAGIVFKTRRKYQKKQINVSKSEFFIHDINLITI